MCDIHLIHALHFYPDTIKELFPDIANLDDQYEQLEKLYELFSNGNSSLNGLRQQAKVDYFSMVHQLHTEQ